MAQTQKIGKLATTVKTENNITTVRFYNTDVVKFDNEKIILNSGGYRTVTTKTRINQTANQFNLNFIVFQKAGCWYVSKNYDYENVVKFTDGMILNRQDFKAARHER